MLSEKFLTRYVALYSANSNSTHPNFTFCHTSSTIFPTQAHPQPALDVVNSLPKQRFFFPPLWERSHSVRKEAQGH